MTKSLDALRCGSRPGHGGESAVGLVQSRMTQVGLLNMEGGATQRQSAALLIRRLRIDRWRPKRRVPSSAAVGVPMFLSEQVLGSKHDS